MPRSEEANARIREEQRRRILAAAERVFARKGLAAAKMSDIARAARVSYGLVYHYFATKEEIFGALIVRGLEGTQGVVEQALARDGTPWQRLEWLTRELLGGMREHPEAAMVVLQALTNEDAPQQVREWARLQGFAVRDGFRRLIAEGQAVGEVVAGDADQLASLYGALIEGLAVDAAFIQPQRPLPDALAVLRMLKA
ncbi:MAG TPA: helix-turn-helix domain-containing protein [Ktedonobacterales bacterium]